MVKSKLVKGLAGDDIVDGVDVESNSVRRIVRAGDVVVWESRAVDAESDWGVHEWEAKVVSVDGHEESIGHVEWIINYFELILRIYFDAVDWVINVINWKMKHSCIVYGYQLLRLNMHSRRSQTEYQIPYILYIDLEALQNIGIESAQQTESCDTGT